MWQKKLPGETQRNYSPRGNTGKSNQNTELPPKNVCVSVNFRDIIRRIIAFSYEKQQEKATNII